MPAGHPLQRLARCTGHKGSDDAFWAIMDWKSEDEHKEKKAVQKTKKPKGNPPGQGTHHKEASHAAPFRGLGELKSQHSVGPWKPTATGNSTRRVGVPGTTRPAEPAAPPRAERRANNQAGGLAQQMMRTAIKMDKRAQRTGAK